MGEADMEAVNQHILWKFREVFGRETLLVRSPGRVNLIGEHTDYNEGFVLPAAIDKAIWLALSPARGRELRLIAVDLDQKYDGETGRLRKSDLRWPDYLLGVIDQLHKKGAVIGGFNCAFGGNIPIGAGLSSSAALEAGLAYALNEMFRLGLPPLELVKLSQKAENEFVGVKCGIMDQFVNIFGREKKVLKIDCRSLAYEYFPFADEDCAMVLCDTCVRRELAGSEYNVRRRQCEEGAALLRRHHPGVASLRDVTGDMLLAHKQEFDPLVYRRCDYVVRENRRVEEACRDLLTDDLVSFGRRMWESHAGLRDDYQVSCAELDILVELASGCRGVLGGRMMGAGFGGCTINLVQRDKIEDFCRAIEAGYQKRIKKPLSIYVTQIESGTAAIA